MWEPSGPLPASVYWRRRWLALASLVAFFAVLGLTVAALVRGGAEPMSSEPTALAANQAALPDPATNPTSPGNPTNFLAPAAVSGTPEVTTGPGTQLPPSATPPGTDETVRQDDTPRAPVAVPPSAPLPATGPVPCTNAMLTVGAEIDRPDHRVGEKPVLRLVVTNVSDQPCVRDLDGSRQEIVVWSGDGADRLWSSNDCVNPARPDLRTLVPGQPLVFAVTWQGRTSTPGCATPRTPVPAGAYRVMTRVDDLISAPTPFLLTPPAR